MSESAVKEKVFTNLIWRFAERCGAQLVAFGISIQLAKILGVELYGTVTLMYIMITIVQVFVDSGLGNALIQKKDADDLDFSTVFITNIVLCIILYIVLFFCAPIIAYFYKDESMIPMIRVLGLTVLISGVKNVQQAYVSKNFLFKVFFYSTLLGTIFAGVLGLYLAANGAGAWALVIQQVTNVFIDTIVVWITVKWRPKMLFSFVRLKGLFAYGWKLLVSSLIDVGYNNLRSLIIGKLYTTADLAYYDKGQRFPSLIIGNINTSIDSVLLPTMSNAQNDREHVKAMTRRAIRVSTYLIAPLMVGLACVGELMLSVLISDEWVPTAFYMRIFCVTFFFYPIHTANLNAIKAMGRSDMFLLLEIIKKTIGFVLLVTTVFVSVKAMAYSLLVSSFASQLINTWPNKKLLGYGYFEQIKDIMPTILLSAFMGLCVCLVGLLDIPGVIVLILQVVVGGAVYIGCSYLLKNDSFFYLLDILKKGLLRRIIK